jgi:hypothetical protein
LLESGALSTERAAAFVAAGSHATIARASITAITTRAS